MPYSQFLLSEMVWTKGSTGNNAAMLVVLILLMGGIGLVLYLAKQSINRNDFLNPAEQSENTAEHVSSGVISKVIIAGVILYLLYTFFSILS